MSSVIGTRFYYPNVLLIHLPEERFGNETSSRIEAIVRAEMSAVAKRLRRLFPREPNFNDAVEISISKGVYKNGNNRGKGYHFANVVIHDIRVGHALSGMDIQGNPRKHTIRSKDGLNLSKEAKEWMALTSEQQFNLNMEWWKMCEYECEVDWYHNGREIDVALPPLVTLDTLKAQPNYVESIDHHKYDAHVLITTERVDDPVKFKRITPELVKSKIIGYCQKTTGVYPKVVNVRGGDGHDRQFVVSLDPSGYDGQIIKEFLYKWEYDGGCMWFNYKALKNSDTGAFSRSPKMQRNCGTKRGDDA
jgi:hypothetical protein